MSPQILLNGERLRATLTRGRRGIDLDVTGVLSFSTAAWDDARLLIAALDAEGGLLGLDDTSVDFERVVQGELAFRESVRLPPALLDRLAALEVWCVAAWIDRAAEWELSLADLPEPGPGDISLHTMPGATVQRKRADEDGEARLTVFGRLRLEAGATYDERADLAVVLLDADGTPVHREGGRIDTKRGAHGDVTFDDWFRPRDVQLERADRVQITVEAKRSAASTRTRIGREAIVLIED